MNFIKPLAVRRLSNTILPAAVRSAIYQGHGSELKFRAPALAPARGIQSFWPQLRLQHLKFFLPWIQNNLLQ